MENNERPKFRKVGALWKPRPGAKSLGSGMMTINGWQQRFIIVRNTKKQPDSKQPDYDLLAADPPTPDEYAQRQHQTAVTRPSEPDDPLPARRGPTTAPSPAVDDEDEIPF